MSGVSAEPARDAPAPIDPVIAGIAARWPGVRVDPAVVRAALAARGLEPGSAIAVDVALVCALAAGDPGALAVFEAELVPDIRGALARLDTTGDLVDEALQQVREKLLVAPGAPRITEYAGRGSLAAWVQVIAIREVLMLHRATRRDHRIGDAALLQAVESDPAVAITKHRFRSELAAAFAAALAALEPRDRALLRLCFVDAVGTERLSEIYAVHRVTMFRWLRDARAHLLEALRGEVIARTGIAEQDVDSLIRAVGSSLDVGW
jgi:RNA polymerase sigma-70 factor (ECF subfamily)